MATPFSWAGPIQNSTDFWARHQQIEEICTFVNQKTSVALYGPRYIGKSSLVNRVAERLAQQPSAVCCLTFDCYQWKAASPATVYQEILATLYRRVRDQEEIPQVSEAYELRDALRAHRLANPTPLVFILDHCDALWANSQIDTAFFSSMRSLMTDNVIRLTCITTTLRVPVAYQLIPSQVDSSPFVTMFIAIEVKPFTVAESREFLIEFARRGGVTFEPDTLTLLLALAGCNPQLLQIAGYHGFVAAQASQRQSVPGIDEQAVRATFLREVTPLWQKAWGRLAAAEQRALLLLPVHSVQDPNSLDRLVDAGLLLKQGGRFSPVSTMLVRFMRGLIAKPEAQCVHVTPILMDLHQRLVWIKGKVVNLTPADFNVLACLLQSPGQLVLNETLIQALPPTSRSDPQTSLHTFIHGLRKILQTELQRGGDVIECRTKVGYIFNPHPKPS